MTRTNWIEPIRLTPEQEAEAIRELEEVMYNLVEDVADHVFQITPIVTEDQMADLVRVCNEGGKMFIEGVEAQDLHKVECAVATIRCAKGIAGHYEAIAWATGAPSDLAKKLINWSYETQHRMKAASWVE